MKEINYFGKEYEVSDKVKWVATDDDGGIWGHEVKPRPLCGRFIYKGGYLELLEDTSKVATNWESSLRKVEDIIVKKNKLKVGDKFVLLGDYHGFKKGQVVEVYKLCADGVHLFKGSNDKCSHCDDDGGAYLSDCKYKVITTTSDKKEFKIRCVDNKGNSYFTVGKEYDCFIIDDSGYKDGSHVVAFNDIGVSNTMITLDNQYGAFEMVDEYNGHPHADLILKYAMIAQYDDKPWESFEFKNQYTDDWMQMVNSPCWDIENEYRLKPQEPKIQIGQVWTSMEGVDVMIDTPSDAKTIYFSFNVFGCHYKNFAPTGEFMRNFKRKE